MHLSPVERDGESTLNLRYSPMGHAECKYLTGKAGLEKARRPASREDKGTHFIWTGAVWSPSTRDCLGSLGESIGLPLLLLIDPRK